MVGDGLAVIALMLGCATMIGVGVWAGLEDETRAAIAQARGWLLAGLGALSGVALLVAAA